MSTSVNKVFILGRLTADPEFRQTQGGASVVTFTVATNEAWTDKSGQKQKRTEFHRVVAWGRLAEICADFLRKGRECHVEGKLQHREYQDKNGQTQRRTEIQATDVQFLGGERAAAQKPSGVAPSAPTIDEVPF